MFATRRVLCAIVLGLLLAAPVRAQVTTADLVGRVTDASGGVLPGATVTLTNDGTRDVRVATTASGGDYVFNLLPIGSYAVAVTLPGFGSQSAKVSLSAGDRVRFDSQIAGRRARRNHHRDRGHRRCSRPTPRRCRRSSPRRRFRICR